MANKTTDELRKIISDFEKFRAIGVFGKYVSAEASSDHDLTHEEAHKVYQELENEYIREDKRRDILEKRAEEEYDRGSEETDIEKITSMDLPMDWENVFNYDDRTQGVHVDSIPDALIMSLTELGYVDIEYISSITGQEPKAVITSLRGAIYQDPLSWNECFYKGWVTAEEYLSGNLIAKLRDARAANEKYRGYFADNVAAIEKLLPPGICSDEIYVTLGSPWVPTDVIYEFIVHLLGLKENGFDGSVLRDELTGKWKITAKNLYNANVRATLEYGTREMNALYLIEKTLNMSSVAVYETQYPYTYKYGAEKKRRVENEDETLAAMDKQRRIIEEFSDWVWKDEARKERLEEIYQTKYGGMRRRIFDGSFLTFPGMSENIELYPFQKDAVARIIFTPNTLLAHDVGAGKTYVMIAAGMELKRMRLSKKNLYVVPNNLVGQWKSIFLAMYPSADLLVIEPKDFTPQKRNAVLMRIASESFDGIIMAYSCFELIPLSLESKKTAVNEQLIKVNRAIKEAGYNAVSSLIRKQTVLNKKRRELLGQDPDDPSLPYFDKLGITRLFVDEAHNFKNVPIETNADYVYGISTNGSQKCKDMLDKVRVVQRQNAGKGVVFATGTPITNSVTDAYVMQLYLQSGELAMLDLQNFDSWIGMFAEMSTNFEVDVDTNKFRLATRFSRFHNLPELTSMLSMIADFHQADGGDDMPESDGGHDCMIKRTPEFERYLQTISQRADAVRSGKVDKRQDNMLKITVDGRKAALDYRLVDENAQFTPNSKVAVCARNVFEIYQSTRLQKCTQLVFCDSSTPKDKFNMYDELKRLLVGMGVPSEEIAYIHEGETQKRRTELFAKVNSGEISILIGSTFKLGLGVNVQQRLIALHHLDVPWRPADMTQREGRILRQGNINKSVRIYRYITEGSFDAYSWQLLETKARFIADLLSGTTLNRSGSEIEDAVLSYAEVKALAIGDPLVKKRVEAANSLQRYTILQRKASEDRMRLQNELMELPNRIEHQREVTEACRSDVEYYAELKASAKREVTSEQKNAALERRKALRTKLKEELDGNILAVNERTLFTYHGFDVILPANMLALKPYIYLKRLGKYSLDMGNNDLGNLRRIDSFLEGLGDHLKKLEGNLEELIQREKDIRRRLQNIENYTTEIELCKQKLAKIDKILKVKKDE